MSIKDSAIVEDFAQLRKAGAINDELEAQLAVARAQRDAWRELVEHCWQLVDAERKRWFK